jgi:hypothetical protein
MLAGLFGFPIDHMSPDQGIILAQFQPRCRGPPIFLGDIHVTAFGAFQLDDDPIAFFRHDDLPRLDLQSL